VCHATTSFKTRRRILVKDYTVKELMVPVSEYASVPEGSTLFDAVLALEKAQEDFDHTKYKHRGVLILDKDRRVVGKLGQLDVLRALEPKHTDASDIDALWKFGFSSNFVHKRHKQRRLKATPLKDLCGKAAQLKVEDFMQAPSEGEFIEQQASLEMAIMQLVMGRHLSLLVTKTDREIIGILRLTDVFAAVFHAMKECEISLIRPEN
jgi:CBS-domain-containing membrane protein